MEKYLSWQGSQLTGDERAKITGTTGKVIWLTGLSGSGKSTLALGAEKQLVEGGRLAYCLDGDRIRKIMNSDLGFTMEERAEHIRRVAVMASLFKDAGVIVLVSVISPLASMRSMAKDIVGEEAFYEVYVKAGIEVCRQRDPKGLYKKEGAGEIKMFTGISSEYEPPVNPNLVLDTEKYTAAECIEQLAAFIKYN